MTKEIIYSSSDISAIILSAGKSGRYGSPKALISFDEKHSFLQKIALEYFDSGVRNIVLVINSEIEKEILNEICTLPKEMKITVVINPHPEEGRFSSIRLAVNAIGDSQNVFIQNIDNPFTTAELLTKMLDKSGEGDFIVPVYHGTNGHPVLISEIVLKHILAMKSDVGNLREVLEKFKSVNVEFFDPNILANINTLEEYSKYFNLKIDYEKVN